MRIINHTFKFGGDSEQTDSLALKVLSGEKTATSSLYDYYLLNKKKISKVGDLAAVVDSTDKEICMVRISKIEVVEFHSITEQFAKEEGDGSIENWLRIHTLYYSQQLAKINKELTPSTKLVCEWFNVI